MVNKRKLNNAYEALTNKILFTDTLNNLHSLFVSFKKLSSKFAKTLLMPSIVLPKIYTHAWLYACIVHETFAVNMLKVSMARQVTILSVRSYDKTKTTKPNKFTHKTRTRTNTQITESC